MYSHQHTLSNYAKLQKIIRPKKLNYVTAQTAFHWVWKKNGASMQSYPFGYGGGGLDVVTLRRKKICFDMNRYIIVRLVLAVGVAILMLSSCRTPRGVVFADRKWHYSDHYGQVIDEDTTFRVTFGDVLIPDPLTIISSADSLAKYPGMDEFLADILHTANLDGAEILFYAPHMRTMFVRPIGDMPRLRPSSITVEMLSDRPFAMWIYPDDADDWVRKSNEMYTYTYLDRGKKQLLRVDHYDYGNTPIAQITIFQSENKATSKMNLPKASKLAFLRKYDFFDLVKYIEFWANKIDTRRKIAIANYQIGQQQSKATNQNR